jgi:hypothetical protein
VKQWRVEAKVTQWHVQIVEANTAEEAWEVARRGWSTKTCQEWDEIEPYGDPEEIEEDEE